MTLYVHNSYIFFQMSSFRCEIKLFRIHSKLLVNLLHLKFLLFIHIWGSIAPQTLFISSRSFRLHFIHWQVKLSNIWNNLFQLLFTVSSVWLNLDRTFCSSYNFSREDLTISIEGVFWNLDWLNSCLRTRNKIVWIAVNVLLFSSKISKYGNALVFCTGR